MRSLFRKLQASSKIMRDSIPKLRYAIQKNIAYKRFDRARVLMETHKRINAPGDEKDFADTPHLLNFSKPIPYPGFTSGNLLRFYTRGNDFFTEMLNEVLGANVRIWIEAYIFKPDLIGFLLVNALVSNARRGTNVVLIYDDIGSGVSFDHLKRLREAGAAVLPFRPFRLEVEGVAWYYKYFFRTHRKIIIVDHVAFHGGMNLTAAHADLTIPSQYLDLHVRYEGPAALELSHIVLETATYLSDSSPSILQDMKESHNYFGLKFPYDYASPSELQNLASCRGSFVQILESNTRGRRFHIQMALENVINDATTSIYIITPYFFPPERFEKALFKAADRGVEIIFLVAGETDVFGIAHASSYVMSKYARRGIKVYSMYFKELHQKSILIDGSFVCIGSYNMDHISFKYNMEVNVIIHDLTTYSFMRREFWRNLRRSEWISPERLDRRSKFQRLLEWTCYKIIYTFWTIF